MLFLLLYIMQILWNITHENCVSELFACLLLSPETFISPVLLLFFWFGASGSVVLTRWIRQRQYWSCDLYAIAEPHFFSMISWIALFSLIAKQWRVFGCDAKHLISAAATKRASSSGKRSVGSSTFEHLRSLIAFLIDSLLINCWLYAFLSSLKNSSLNFHTNRFVNNCEFIISLCTLLWCYAGIMHCMRHQEE